MSQRLDIHSTLETKFAAEVLLSLQIWPPDASDIPADYGEALYRDFLVDGWTLRPGVKPTG
jgi:hypothetical protein